MSRSSGTERFSPASLASFLLIGLAPCGRVGLLVVTLLIPCRLFCVVRIVLVTEARLQKSLKVYTDNIPAAKAWRDVGKCLGLTPEDLQEIGGPAPPDKTTATTKQMDHGQVREEARKMLEKWMETAGENASVDQLLSAVQKLKLNDVAGTYIHVR